MNLIVTTVGAVLTTLVGVLVGSLASNRSQQRQWLRDRQADACALVLRESSNVVVELGKLNGSGVKPAAEGVCIPTPIDWRPWNEALVMVNMVCDHRVAVAAHAIDAAIWPAHLQVNRGWTADGDWFRLRDEIEAKRRDFINVARERFASPGPPLQRLDGRPSSNDPIWEFRRSYFSASGGSERSLGRAHDALSEGGDLSRGE